MRIDIITIFGDYFTPLGLSLMGKAQQRELLSIGVHDLRSWTHDRHNTVDDTPSGGGPGMVMLPEPWSEALTSVTSGVDAGVDDTAHPPAEGPRLILPTPSGTVFTQRDAERLAREPWLVFACGRYEGIDARFAEEAATRMPVEELSIGDYVLAGGEVATLVMIEAIARLLPGVLGNAESAVQDSFAEGAMSHLVEGPVYTKPPVWRGREVPPVLLSGHHGAIDRWRRDEALRKTARNRPELLRSHALEEFDARDREVLAEEDWPSSSVDMAD